MRSLIYQIGLFVIRYRRGLTIACIVFGLVAVSCTMARAKLDSKLPAAEVLREAATTIGFCNENALRMNPAYRKMMEKAEAAWFQSREEQSE